jgi:hypothetical protein
VLYEYSYLHIYIPAAVVQLLYAAAAGPSPSPPQPPLLLAVSALVLQGVPLLLPLLVRMAAVAACRGAGSARCTVL